MTFSMFIAQATTNPATAAAAENPSIWNEVKPWEIALLGAGVLLTLVIVGVFIWLAVRAGREERGASTN